ncbi:MAG: PilZ domain-containing protein [Deltaproteobacteria bacterium]|nr:PilZ domain-containing protein [Deltaproteobacteria bacterium]
MNDQNRTFSRVPTRIKGHARLVPGPEVQPMFSGCAACNLDITSDILAGSGFPPQAAKLLSAMNTKIDMILGHLDQQDVRDDYPLGMDIVELSAAGLKFMSERKFTIDEHLEAVLILSRYPLRMAGVVGTVVREESWNDNPLYVVGFTNLREQDREAIIQFVFQEQREIIRRGKHAE